MSTHYNVKRMLHEELISYKLCITSSSRVILCKNDFVSLPSLVRDVTIKKSGVKGSDISDFSKKYLFTRKLQYLVHNI